MATREIIINQTRGKFLLVKQKEKYDFSGLSDLRKILSNEKARILDVIKNEKPSSIYDLAKRLKRNFKPVYEDVKLLERFGFIELIPSKKKHKILTPKLLNDSIHIVVNP
jgi:predicted transcriptional regulator